MRIVMMTAAMLGLLAAPAYAQKGSPPPSDQKTPLQIQDELKARELAEAERQYELMRKARPPAAEAAKTDPWGNMRSTTPPREKR
jgi:hypothetical protein